MLRRLKDDVGLELPTKTRQTVFVTIPEKDGRSFERKKEDLRRTQMQTKASPNDVSPMRTFRERQMLLDLVGRSTIWKKYIIEQIV